MSSNTDWHRIALNPAYMPKDSTSTIVTIPILSSIGFDIKTPYIGKEAMTITNNKITDIYIDEFFRALGDRAINGNMDINLLGVGFRKNKHFFSINIALHSSVYGIFDKELTDYLAKGNGSYLGKTMHSETFAFDGYAWGELNLGFSTKAIMDKLSIGGRLRILSGIASLKSTNNNLAIKTTEMGDKIEIYLQQNLQINAPIGVKKDTNNRLILKELFSSNNNFSYSPFSNFGLGLDLGAEYELNDKITLGTAITNLNFISWNAKNSSEVAINVTKNDPIVIEGVSFSHKLINKENDSKEEKNDFEKTIERNSKVTNGKSYTTSLPTFYNLTTEYKLSKTFKTKALLGLVDRHNGFIGYEIALLGHFQPSSWFSASLSISKNSYQPVNFGSALVFGDGFQMVIGSENLFGANGRNFSPNIFAGFNIRL